MLRRAYLFWRWRYDVPEPRVRNRRGPSTPLWVESLFDEHLSSRPLAAIIMLAERTLAAPKGISADH
jgi:hypothetical protein